jgi:protein TonB
MGTSKDDLMLFPGFSIEEKKPRSRLALKVTIVLLVVAALAAGQWFWRGKIIDAVHKYVTPYIRIVHPSQAEPNAAPVSTTPKPVAPAPVAPPAAVPAPQQTGPAPAAEDKVSPGNGTTPPASKPTAPPKGTKAPPSNGPAELRPPHLLHRVDPVSPPDLNAESTVILNATVLKDGSIGKVTVVNGAPALHPAAIATVRQWQYRPAYQNGQPVPATVDVELTFKASH